MIQLQNVIGRLQGAGTALPDETQQLIGRAQSLIRDVAAARQVHSNSKLKLKLFFNVWFKP